MLHIRKTGGTALKAALAPVAKELGLRTHAHRTTLVDIPPGEGVMFVVRDPVDRFVSGFNSRLRQGRPRFDRPWTPEEAAAFQDFPDANSLANALADHDVRAEAAMQAIRELGRPMTDWLPETVLERRWNDVMWFGFTETLTRDFEAMKARLRLPSPLHLPSDDVVAHRSPLPESPQLDGKGRTILQERFADDYRLLDLLKKRQRPNFWRCLGQA